MSITRKLFLFIVLVTLSLAGIPVSANEVYDASVSQMLAEQSQRIQQLENQLTSLNQGQYLHSSGDGCCDDCDDGCGGFIGGAEITFLKAHNNALSLSAVPLGSIQVLPEYDYEMAPRFWLGYQFAGGLGFRATYWGYDQAVASTTLPVPLTVGLEATTVDLELTQAASFCKWDLLVSGGLRYGRIDDQITIDLGGPLGLSREFEGVGATVALGVRRPLGCSGLALIGSARGSLLFGSTDASVDLTPFGLPVSNVAVTNDQQVLEIYEIRMGGEWSRDLANGARFYTQAVYEAQAWNVAPIILGIGDSQIGFSGLAFNIGLAR